MSDADPRAYERLWTTRALFAANRIYARAWHRVEIFSPCTIPADGPAILICNHSGGLDPAVLQATCPRLITWMMAKEYYDLPVLGAMCQRLGYIPVSRNGRDSASLKAALRALAAGKVLGIFPEGRIAPGKELLAFQGGVGVMAQRAGAPVYPAYIKGLERNISVPAALISRQEVRIAYGPPIQGTSDDPLSAEALRESVDTLRRQMLAHSPLHGRFVLNVASSGIGDSLKGTQTGKKR